MSSSEISRPYGLEEEAFALHAVHPATLKENEALRQFFAAAPPMSVMTAKEHRAIERSGGSPFATRSAGPDVETLHITGDGVEIPVRVFRTPGSHGVYLHFHGGGWILGGADMQDAQLRQMAHASGATVVSVEYRLSPEHPYPAAPNDCETAALWLIDNGPKVFGTASFCMGGESAGAHLALVTALRLRNQNRMGGLRGLNLVSGMYNLALRSLPAGAELTGENLKWILDQFCPDEALRQDPDVSPLWASLENLPPTLVTVGSLDPCIADSAAIYARLLAASVSADIAVWPGGMHAFASLPGILYDKTQSHQAEFLRARLDGVVVTNARKAGCVGAGDATPLASHMALTPLDGHRDHGILSQSGVLSAASPK